MNQAQFLTSSEYGTPGFKTFGCCDNFHRHEVNTALSGPEI